MARAIQDKLREVLAARREEYLGYLFQLLSKDTSVIGHGIAGGLEKAGQDFLEDLLSKMGAELLANL